MIERRRSLRALASLPVWLKDGHGGERSCTLDVSAHGVAIATDRARATRQYVELELVLPGGQPLQITAMVARSEGQVVGLDFFTLEAEVSHRWRRFVAEVLASRAPEAARSPSRVGPAPWVSATVAPARRLSSSSPSVSPRPAPWISATVAPARRLSSSSPSVSPRPAPSTVLSAEPPDPASAVRSIPPASPARMAPSAPADPAPRSSTKIARRRAMAPRAPSLGSSSAAGAPSWATPSPERSTAGGPTPILASVEPPALMVRPRNVGRLWAFERSELARSVVRLESPVAQLSGGEVDVIVVHPVTAQEWTFGGRVVATRRGRSGRPVVDVGLFGVDAATRDAFRVFITSGSAEAAPSWAEDSGEERLPSEIVDIDDFDAPDPLEPSGDEASMAGLLGLEAEPTQAAGDDHLDPDEEPTRAGLEAVADPDAPPTGSGLSDLDDELTGPERSGPSDEPTGPELAGPNADVEPPGSALSGLNDEPTGVELEGLDDEPTGAELEGPDAQPTGSGLSGLDDEATGSEGLDAEPTAWALSGLDDDPTGAELEGLDAEPTAWALSGLDDELTGAELEGLDAEPTGSALEPREVEATDEALEDRVIAAPTRPDSAARDEVAPIETELDRPESGAGAAEEGPAVEAIGEPGRPGEPDPRILANEAGASGDDALAPVASPPGEATLTGPARRREAVPRSERVTAAHDEEGWSDATGAILLEPRRRSDPIVVPLDRSERVDPDHWTLDAFIEAASGRAEATDASSLPPVPQAPPADVLAPGPTAGGIPTAPGRRARGPETSASRAEVDAEAEAVARIAEPELPDAVVVPVSPPLAPPPELPIEEEDENLPLFVSAPGSAVLDPGPVAEVFGPVASDSLFASFFKEAARPSSGSPHAQKHHRLGGKVADPIPPSQSAPPEVRSEPAPALRSAPAVVPEPAPGGGLRVLPHRTVSRLERDAMRATAPPVGRPLLARTAGRPPDPASVVVTPADPDLVNEPQGRSALPSDDVIPAGIIEPREALGGRPAVSRERAGAHQQMSTAGTNPGLDRDIALARARLVRASDEAEAAFELAELLRSRRHSEALDEALEVYARVLRLRPNDGATHARSAELHARRGRYRQALIHLERAEGLNAEVDEDLARWVRKAVRGDAR